MSTARFERIKQFARGNEGNYSNIAGDTGGETYRGISRVWNPTWQGWVIIDAYKRSVNRPLRNNELIKNNALEVLISDFYFANFYSVLKCESYKNESVATTVYDYALGVDPNDATKLVQKILNANFGKKLPVDGLFGNQTLTALNIVDAKAFFDIYNEARKQHYINRANTVANQAQFLPSWLSRLNKLKFSTSTAAVSITAVFFWLV